MQRDKHNLKKYEASHVKCDAGDARRLLFSIIYVCKSIVFLCFRS